ncbi:nuclear protein 1b [Rhinoraja longicauda]
MSSESLESFEEAHYDEYEYYNLADYQAHGGGKGRRQHWAAGNGRKVTEKLYNSEMKKKRLRSSAKPRGRAPPCLGKPRQRRRSRALPVS